MPRKPRNNADTSDTPNVYYVDLLPDAVKIIEDTVARTLLSAEALRNKLRQSLSQEDDPDATQIDRNALPRLGLAFER